MSNINLDTDSINKTFFKFAIPSILGLLIVSMQIMIDGIFVGNFVGPSGLAAINISMPYIHVIMGICMMITSGGGVIAAIHLGKKDNKSASEVTTYTLIIGTITLFIISVISLLFIDNIILFLGASGSLISTVKSYLQPMLFLILIFSSPIFTETFARIGGRPNSVFISGVVCCTANVTLDYLFIVVLSMGIKGAAYATCIANLLGFIALLPYFYKGRLSLTFKRPKYSFTTLKTIFYNGSSEMFSIIAAAITAFLFNRIIMKEIGPIGVSALTIVFYVNTIVNIALYGLSQALQPIIAYNLGANRIDKIRDTLKISIITGGGIGIVSFILMNFFSLPIVQLFTKGDVELTMLANTAIKYFVFAYLLSFVNIIAAAFHTAVEMPMESILLAVLRSLILVAIFLFLLPPIFGEKGIWMAVPIAELTCLFISLYLMISSFKKIHRSNIKV